MYSNIIVSLSLEHGIGDNAIELARKLLNEGGKITAIHVSEPLQGSVKSYVSKEAIDEGMAQTKKMLADRIGDSKDIDGLILQGHSAQGILDYAKKVKADCIIVGSHKPGLKDHLLGSTASRTVRHSPCSVHVLRT